ncbi:MAG TPA: hypothetical protein DCR28_00420 [Eubacterium sp.]|nr:hypothetical protein [Eubacterium sp.]
MDNINNTQAPEPKESNKKIIIIASIAIAVLVALFVILGLSLGWFGGKGSSNDDGKKGQIPATINVVETKGSEGATKKVKIKVRDVKFGDKLKAVKAFEKKQEDTLASPSEASTKDGYTYLTYQFSPKAEFFGIKPSTKNGSALLQYVFKKKKLFDIRIQFGDISKKQLTKLQKKLTDKYGKPTFSSEWSNDSWKDAWRTASKDPKKQTLLELNYSPQGGTVISYQSVDRDFK